MGKKSKSTSSKTVYGKTTTTNPYVTSKTDNSGTVSAFKTGTAVNSINDFVNKNIDNLLYEYLNPTLNSTVNQSKMNAFVNNLSNASQAALENDIINPLSKRNMIRSSQATNMYNNLAKNNVNQIANYAQELLTNSQSDTASMLTNLMLMYMNAYNILNDTQMQSLSASKGNATGSNSANNSNYLDMSNLMQKATQAAMMMASVI